MPNAAISTNVGGMGAHWTAACPRPADDEVPDFLDPAVLDDALTRAEELLAVTTHVRPTHLLTVRAEGAG